MPPERLRKLVLIAVLFITAAVYLPALTYGFVCDDPDQIVRMQPRYTWHAIPSYFTTDVWSYLIVAKSNYYRPIFLLWMMLNSQAFGLETEFWHASAIALHLLAVALLYFLARRLTGSTITAGIAALLFGVHPVHVEAVAWISGTTEPLCAALAFGTLLCYLRSREPGPSALRWRMTSIALYALCVFSKETAILLPVLIGAYELLFDREQLSGKRASLALRAAMPFLLVCAVYLGARYYALGGLTPMVRSWTPRMLAATLPGVLLFYLQHSLLPWRYSLFYPIGPVVAFDFQSFWVPLLIVLLAAAVLLAISLRSRAAAFCSLLLVLPILPALNLRAFFFDDFLHDRYVYLPSAGLCILLAMGIEHLCSNRPVLRVMVVAALTLYLCALNLNASRYWSDDLALYTHSYEQAPDSHIVQVDLGYALVKAQRFLEARPLLASALAANAQDYNTYVGLGECYAAVDDLDEAAGYFKDAILFHPRSSSAYVHLAGVEARQNQLTEAEAHMRQGLEFRETLTADTRTYHYLLGTILEQEMKFKDALAEYEADLEEDPASALASERAELLRHALQR